MNFTQLVDLASQRLGGRALIANDEFFAPKQNLLKTAAPIFIPDKYTPRGKWMDGWETRRRRTPGYDWCVVRLGLRGIIRGAVVDTSHFTGNYPESCSLEALDASGPTSSKILGQDPGPWTEILSRVPLKGDSLNEFSVESAKPWTHVRLKIHPDGGIARLRIHGEVLPDWKVLTKVPRPVDLAAVANGGWALSCSDSHFSSPANLLMPGPGKNMGDGWETRRRRGPGHDWCLIRLGTIGVLEKIEVDTAYFKGNYPESFLLEGILAPNASAQDIQTAAGWTEILPRAKLAANKRHVFAKGLSNPGPFSHVRLNIYPDGGVSRLRLYGRPQNPQ